MKKEFCGISGKVEFILETPDGKKIRFENNNLIMLNGLYTFGEALAAACGSATHSITGSPYIAVGTDGTFPQSDDLTLGAETFRKIVLPTYITRMNLYNYFEMVVESNEANTTLPDKLRECGLFINNATAAADSGTLVARALVAPEMEKTLYKRLTIKWAIKVERIE